MKHKNKNMLQAGIAHIEMALVAVVVIGLVGVLGFVGYNAWQNNTSGASSWKSIVSSKGLSIQKNGNIYRAVYRGNGANYTKIALNTNGKFTGNSKEANAKTTSSIKLTPSKHPKNKTFYFEAVARHNGKQVARVKTGKIKGAKKATEPIKKDSPSKVSTSTCGKEYRLNTITKEGNLRLHLYSGKSAPNSKRHCWVLTSSGASYGESKKMTLEVGNKKASGQYKYYAGPLYNYWQCGGKGSMTYKGKVTVTGYGGAGAVGSSSPCDK